MATANNCIKIFPKDGELRAMKEPNLAKLKLRPNADESALPLNHLAIIVVIATIMIQLQDRKSTYPKAISQKVLLNAVTIAPRRI